MMKHIACLLSALLILTFLISATALAWEIETLDVDEEMYVEKSSTIYLNEVPARITYDLPYCGENSTAYQKLHLLLPEEGEGPFPIILSVHGGSWRAWNSTAKKGKVGVSYTQQVAFHGLKRGYAVACMDYSVVNKENTYAFPRMIQEVRAAVRYLRSIAPGYNLDPDHVVLIGESAGGMLVDMAALVGGDRLYDNPEFGNMEFSGDVQAVIAQYSAPIMSVNGMTASLFGVSEEELTQEMADSVTAINFVDANDPPFFIEAGTADSTIPYTNSVTLYETLVEAGVQNCELHIYEGMEHGSHWFQSEEMARLHFDWLDGLFGRN